MFFRKITLICCFFLLSLSLQAKESTPPLSSTEVPAVLREWIPFALFGINKKDFEEPCPYFYNNVKNKICNFPNKVKIDLTNGGFVFYQEWKSFDKGFLTLVGGYGLWPQNVVVNDKKTPVVIRNNKPSVFVNDAGNYIISGRVKWERMPETIEIPVETAAVEFFIDGKKLETPEIDSNGRIRLKRKQKIEVKASDSASIKISRHIIDDIPTKMETLITLDISGQERDLILANPEIKGFKTVGINFPLSVKIEEDGNYRVYAKAGRWSAKLISVVNDNLPQITLHKKTKGLTVSEEIWTFEAKPELRSVQIQGVQAVDPSLTDIPKDKRRFPAYLVRVGDSFVFDEKNRGFDTATPNVLSLNRRWIMNLDGSGYFINDNISGEINQNSRLEMVEGELGRVSINGISQLITKLDENAEAGVEVRQGQISLDADSRITNNISHLDVNGWNTDFQRVNATLVLPPGWSLFEAIGADKAYPTWVGSWSLLDVFIVLVTSVAIYKLMGIPYGMLSFLTLTLTNNEFAIASWLLLFAIIFISLEKILPEGFLLKMAALAKKIIFLILLINLASFSITHTKRAIYPSIYDFHYGSSYRKGASSIDKAKARKFNLKKEVAGFADSAVDYAMESVVMPRVAEQRNDFEAEVKTYNLQNMLKDTNVQTGLGVSEWQGKEINLYWNSMVGSGHKINLIFISAKLNLVLSFVRVLLLWLLMVVLIMSKENIRIAKDFANKHIFKNASRIATILVLMNIILTAKPVLASENVFPSPEMLQELKHRLLPEKKEIPDCFPNCINLEKTHIAVKNNILSIRNVVHIEGEDDIIFPLPTISGEWRPKAIIVNGEAFAPSAYQNNATFIALSKGINDVETINEIPDIQTVQINFPIKSSIVTSLVDNDWIIRGINDDQTVNSVVQLIREKPQKIDAKSEAKFSSPQIKPFLIVERNIDLGISWNVTTIVRTVTPSSLGAVVKIPLIKGEAVTTKNIDVVNGNAVINVTTDTREIVWNSVLEQKSLIELYAEKDVSFSEIWKVNAGNIWNVQTKGLPRIINNQSSNTMIFRPWAGEDLKIAVLRPQAVEGQIKTFDKIDFAVRPSERNLNASLDMALRSSLGTQHKIKLPQEAKSPTVFINGTRQFANFEDEYIVFPVVPGEQNIKVEWTQATNIKNFFELPQIDVAESAVNINVSAEIPHNRWVLLAGGASISPIILFWGVLPLIAMLAFALGRYPSSIPLKGRHWFLLFLGLSQSHMTAIAIITIWFIALEIRKNNYIKKSKFYFNLTQVFLIFFTFLAFNALISGIGSGLLGTPEMSVVGYRSSSYWLSWYQDFSYGLLPKIWILSLPVYVWRGLMLLWALWLSFAITSWIKWAFACFSSGGIWQKNEVLTSNED